ncbi:MAG: ExbD/TolR family protein [Nannocystaceae bacterium]|nr:biopolymer transporter ExbD [bacterium]
MSALDFTRREPVRPRVNLSALIDVAFILVIFIVLTATYREDRDMDVSLPEASRVPQHEAKGLNVLVRADGTVEIEGQVYASDAVFEILQGLRAKHDSVVLLADRQAAVEAAVAVLADARAAGFSSASIATKEKRAP